MPGTTGSFRTVRVSELKKGMRVTMPASWMDHPFLRNEFVITSGDQIRKIVDSGFEEVVVDASTMGEDRVPAEDRPRADLPPPPTWDPSRLVPDELREAIHDVSLPPARKATIVYNSSLMLMERLFQDPKAENIGETKKVVAEVVDMIIADDATAQSLLTITSYDFYTYTHSVNVGVLSVVLAKALFRDSGGHDMHELGAGFFLHDIGKVRIDPGIINKPGSLTDEEMGIVRSHPYQGFKILRDANHLSEECRIIVMEHHERVDGTGYPRGLKGGDIHLYGRICCIADVYDALTAERSYKQQMKPFEAMKFMKEKMLDHFQRDLFDRFVLLFG